MTPSLHNPAPDFALTVGDLVDRVFMTDIQKSAEAAVTRFNSLLYKGMHPITAAYIRNFSR